MDQGNWRAPFGNNDFFALFGPAQILSQPILEFFDAYRTHKAPLQVAIVATLVSVSSEDKNFADIETDRLHELHSQRIVRIEPGVSVDAFVAFGELVAELFLVAHVEQGAIGI